jgi:hypothetical protein
MLNLPVPRRSFLDSRLRNQSHESRRIQAGRRTGDSHLGLGPRLDAVADRENRRRTTWPTAL